MYHHLVSHLGGTDPDTEECGLKTRLWLEYWSTSEISNLYLHNILLVISHKQISAYTPIFQNIK